MFNNLSLDNINHIIVIVTCATPTFYCLLLLLNNYIIYIT